MKLTRVTVPVVTIADGSATAYSPALNGNLRSITYTKPAEGGFAAGVDFTITTEKTKITIWTEVNVNASAAKLPHIAVHDNAGTAIEYSAGVPVCAPIPICDERVKIVIADGGDGGIGTFDIVIEGVAY